MHRYQKGPVIGEGTYGTVVCATDKISGQCVALKKVKLRNSKEGVNMSVLRELKALKALKSPYIVDLLDVLTTKSSLVLVFEFMDWSLEDVIRDKNCQLTAADIKAYMRMLLQALAHVHSHQTVHRDVKPDNMLIAGNGVMKLADFGLARSLDSSEDSSNSSPESSSKLTPQVFGRWYRPPELLLGCSKYGCAVDMWAAGCVLAELLLRRPWFPGNSDYAQLTLMFEALGVPTLETWPGLADLQAQVFFKPASDKPSKPLTQIFQKASEDCLDLLQQLMRFDPAKRITAAAALQHPYFSNDPQGTPVADLPRPSSTRANRSNTESIPAMLHDMLMRPDTLVRQQQQQAMQSLASSRKLFSDANGYSFSRYMHSSAACQQGRAPDSLLVGPDAAAYGASRLSRDCGSSACDRDEQHTGLGQPDCRWFTVSGLSEDVVHSDTLKCRLSFGSMNDEPSGMQEQPNRPNSVEVGQETAYPAAVGDEQQAGLRRPSPMACSNLQQQNSSKSSMRPPLHRTGSAQAAAIPNTTPVLSQPCSVGAVVQGHSCPTAAGQKRRVSDLNTALSSAAAAPSMDVLDGLSADAHAQHCVDADHHAGGQAMLTATPAAMQRGSSSDMPGVSMPEADAACPMSSGASTQKRSRAVFETAGPAAVHVEQDTAPAANEQQQEQQNAMPMSINRRYLRGRRSSIGCCNMETDTEDQPQQHSVVGSMLPPASHSGHPDHSTTKHGMQSRAAHCHIDSTQHVQPDSKQQQLEALLSGDNTSLGLPHNKNPAQGALPLLQPWQQVPADSRNLSCPGHETQHPSDLAMASVHSAADKVPQAAEVDRFGGRHRQAAGTDDSKGSIPAPNTADSTAGGDSVGPCTSHRLGCLIGGLQEGLPAVQTVGNTPGEIDAELAQLDHHQLAEWASQWKPVVQSAEKRYLVERKLQMDEALLQASQPDPDTAPAGVFSPDMHPRKTVMFENPVDDRRCNSELHVAIAHRVHGQIDNLQAQIASAAACNDAAASLGSNPGEAVPCFCMTD